MEGIFAHSAHENFSPSFSSSSSFLVFDAMASLHTAHKHTEAELTPLQSSAEMPETCSEDLREQRAEERSTGAGDNPLHQRGILQQVLDFVGPAQHLFLSPVSKSFRACYLNTPVLTSVYQDESGDVEITLVHHMTAFGAVLGSPSRVRLAAELGFVLNIKNLWSQFLAGAHSSIETLVELHEQYQMRYTEVVCRGAAVAGSVSKLQWLLDEQQCPQPDDIDRFAVNARTTDILKWLKQRGCVFTADTCAAAARSLQAAQMLEYLHSEGVPFDVSTMTEAIACQTLPLVQWLHKHGCPLSEEASLAASKLKDLAPLSWLHSVGCPCDYWEMCYAGLVNGFADLMQWIIDNDIEEWTPTSLSLCLNIAGVYGHLDTAKVRNKQAHLVTCYRRLTHIM
jgi:hypothetical protein